MQIIRRRSASYDEAVSKTGAIPHYSHAEHWKCEDNRTRWHLLSTSLLISFTKNVIYADKVQVYVEFMVAILYKIQSMIGPTSFELIPWLLDGNFTQLLYDIGIFKMHILYHVSFTTIILILAVCKILSWKTVCIDPLYGLDEAVYNIDCIYKYI